MRRISGLLHRLATRGAGLSLMELTVVAAILALLSALTAVAVTGSLGSTTAIVKQNDEAEATKAATSFSGIHPESFFPVTLQNRKPKVFQLTANLAQQLGVGDGSVSVAVFEIDWDACDDGTSGVCSKPAKRFAPDYIKKPQHADLPPAIDTDGSGVPELRLWVIVESTGEAKVLVPSNLYGSDRVASASAPTPTPAPTFAPPPTPTPAPPPIPTPIVSTAPTLIATVTLPASPRVIAVNSVTHRAYVAVGSYPNPSTYFVSVIDGATNIADIPVGAGDFSSGPIFTAVNETTNRVYVNHTGSNFASVINGGTNTRIATIGTGSYPEGIAADPTRDRLYIANTNSGNVQVINTAGDANTLLQTITVPGSGAGITNLYLTLIPATNRIFVTAPGLNKIVVIDGGSGTVTATFLVADSPRMIAADPTTNRLYVTLDGSPSVLVLDATNGSTVATIPLGGVASHVAVNPTTHRIYATTAAGLKVIDDVTNSVSATVPVSSPVWVAADTSNGRIYVTTTNSVMVLQD